MSEDFKDSSSQDRKLGLLQPTGVKAAKTWESENKPLYTDDQIRQIITASGRVTAREEFDDHWVEQGDQENIGSCNGWAMASVASKTRHRQGIKDGLVLSGSYGYSLINGGRDNGSQLADDVGVLTDFGLPPASLCGPQLWRRNQTKQFDTEAAKHKGLNFLPINTLQGLKTALAMEFLVVVAVQVGSRFNKVDSKGITQPDSGNGNHAIHADDLVIINNRFYADTVNNWNLRDGVKGRRYYPIDGFNQTIQVHQFWALEHVLEA